MDDVKETEEVFGKKKKKKKDVDKNDKEQEEWEETWDKLNPSFSETGKKKKRKRGKKAAIITNIYSRLKSLDFMLKKEKKISLHIGEIGGFDEEAYHAHRPERARKYRKERIARQEKEKPDISRELRA